MYSWVIAVTHLEITTYVSRTMPSASCRGQSRSSTAVSASRDTSPWSSLPTIGSVVSRPLVAFFSYCDKNFAIRRLLIQVISATPFFSLSKGLQFAKTTSASPAMHAGYNKALVSLFDTRRHHYLIVCADYRFPRIRNSPVGLIFALLVVYSTPIVLSDCY